MSGAETQICEGYENQKLVRQVVIGSACYIADAMHKIVFRIEIVQVRRLPLSHHLRIGIKNREIVLPGHDVLPCREKHRGVHGQHQKHETVNNPAVQLYSLAHGGYRGDTGGCDASFSPHITMFHASQRMSGNRVSTVSNARSGIHQRRLSGVSRRIRFQ